MLDRISAISIKEFRQLRRDRTTFAMIVMIPLVQLVLFGFAINTNLRHLPAGFVDMENSSYSRAIIMAVQATQVVDFIEQLASPADAENAITAGRVKAVLILPKDTSQRLITASNPQANYFPLPVGQWLVDGSDTIIGSTLRELRTMPLTEALDVPAAPATPTFEVVEYFNPEQRSVVNIVPGLIGVILTMTMVLFTSTAIVREREHGNMEFLITTPVRSLELMLGKIVPYVLIGLIQLFIILTMGHLIFDVPVRGGVLNIVIVAILFIGASLTLGLVISTIAKTQLQAMQMTVFVLLPSILLSGFMFPYEAMPVAAQWIAEALPATHFIRMSRAIILRDAPLMELTLDCLWLIGFTVVGLIAASLRFKKQL